jgi:hypothetical protein
MDELENELIERMLNIATRMIIKEGGSIGDILNEDSSNNTMSSVNNLKNNVIIKNILKDSESITDLSTDQIIERLISFVGTKINKK